jgi:hypothetical protein
MGHLFWPIGPGSGIQNRKVGEFDSSARSGVRRLALFGTFAGDEGQAGLGEERFTMDFITADQRPARVEMLDIETVITSSALPAGRKWAIRFNASGTVTIVLGMRDYGRGWFSAYFAGLVAARLGVPFRRVRVYYSANLPAVLQTPVPSPIRFWRGDVGPLAAAAAATIERMCDQVIEKGRLAFAAMADIGVRDVGFDQPTGLFFVLDRERSGYLLDLARAIPCGSPKSTEFAMKIQSGNRV